MTSICLALIVKDEEQVIARCIESIRDLIDYWVICDTGSTDGTRARAQNALRDIPGEWHERPWVDFGHNRSELMALARGKADYLLLLDADETLTWTAGVKAKLAADAYTIVHRHPEEQWTNQKLVRGDIAWRYVGAAHELLRAPRKIHTEFLPDVVINVHVDRSERAPKLRRNLELLLRELGTDPHNERTRFYVAETYRDLFYQDDPSGNPDHATNAITEYRARIEQGGDSETLAYCLFNVAVLTADALDDWPAAMASFVEAWELFPDRLEPLYELVKRMRMKGQVNTAYALVRPALEIERPSGGLFVRTWVYDWGIHVEHALLAGLAGDTAAALAATESLLANPTFPAEHSAAFEQMRQSLEALGPS